MKMEPQSNGPVYTSASSMPAGNKKRLLWIVVAVVLVVAAVLVYVLTKSSGSSRVAADEPTYTVTIDENGFTPATIRIAKGEELAWVNGDKINAHEVTADQQKAPGLDSNTPLLEGDTYIYQFEESGTYNFYDPANPDKYNGTVIVE